VIGKGKRDDSKKSLHRGLPEKRQERRLYIILERKFTCLAVIVSIEQGSTVMPHFGEETSIRNIPS